MYRYPPRGACLLSGAPRASRRKHPGAALNQPFAGKSAVTFFWTARLERTEWRYSEASVKVSPSMPDTSARTSISPAK
ncbi:hypothetical protein MASR2M17_18450 [Aminivibrio sp.]